MKYTDIPYAVSYKKEQGHLILRGAEKLPKEVFLFAKQYPVKILDVTHGTLKSISDELAESLPDLSIALFSQNTFSEVPSVLGRCPKLKMLSFKSCNIEHCSEESLPSNLEWLILTGNKLQSLPNAIGKLKNLRKLALAGNLLHSIPSSFIQCTSLELIRLSANKLTEVPTEILHLPRLTWFCDAGNLYNEHAYQQHQNLEKVPTYTWEDFCIGELLGESPSSEVFSATMRASGEIVAIKRYRGALTSDGYPMDDLRAGRHVGSHPHLVSVKGQIMERLDSSEASALVLSLVPSFFTRLGLPPSFESCTRDTFPEERSYSLSFIKRVLFGIAQGSKHLVDRNLFHGDLYAHNILVDTGGYAILGDYGATSFGNAATRSLRERIEVRAFGCLIEDLLGISKELQSTEYQKLRSIADVCLSDSAHPLTFDECIKLLH